MSQSISEQANRRSCSVETIILSVQNVTIASKFAYHGKPPSSIRLIEPVHLSDYFKFNIIYCHGQTCTNFIIKS